MILVIGGAYSGKTDFVISKLGYGRNEISDSLDCDAPVLSNFHLLLKEHDDIGQLMGKLSEKKVVICDEVGCGVIPIDKADREWRERVGRICCRLAESADAVVRLNCGVAAVIKGEIK